TVKKAWQGAANWFQDTVITPLENAFNLVTGTIRYAFESAFSGIVTFIKNQVNTVIHFLNTLISAFTGAVNAVIDAVNSLNVYIPNLGPLGGGYHWGVNIGRVYPPTIPRLATGAVIPPNAQFMAMLGDQRSGRNLEAPEALIRQIVREEAGGGCAQGVVV